ncbi:Inositol-1-monophosphatase [compost metagenome]
MAEGATGVRRLGATVLDLAYVASGRLDGFCGVGLKPWDLAAGSLMVLEAGGLIADFDGEQGWMDSGNVLAATPKIFTQMLGSLNPPSAA